MNASKPVSYTHLIGLRLIVRNSHYLRFECPDGGSTFSIERVDSVPPGEQVTIYFESDDLAGPVSYTHLDVYKRQPIGTVKSWLSRGRVRLATELEESQEMTHGPH